LIESFLTWLTLGALGILFGLIPGYSNSGDILREEILVKKKKVAKWLYFIFNIDTKNTEFTLSEIGPRKSRRLSHYISIGYVILILAFYHYIGKPDIISGNLARIFIGETSFPVFLLLSWLLPVIFIKRYLNKIKPPILAEIDHYTFDDE
jgi:hypothetical protein